jgi:diguanylate cyclase (GGDEF)-like protein
MTTGTGAEQSGAIRVLLVEDNPGDARLIREMLKEVRSAEIGLTSASFLGEALSLVGREAFAIVLLDLNLPDSSGIETFSRMHGEAPDLPIVVLSGFDDENAAVHAVQEGAQDYLVKGRVDGDLLVRSIRYAIERNKMSMAIRSMSLFDELTGLHNRRGFLTLAEQQLKTAVRLSKRAVLIFIDMDGMKQINDTFGHNEGNLALRETADLLRTTFRDADIVARMGGDEFVVLALMGETDDSDVLCQRLEQNLAQGNAREGRRYTLSLSLGVAFHDPSRFASVEEFIDEADHLMYERKKAKKAAWTESEAAREPMALSSDAC